MTVTSSLPSRLVCDCASLRDVKKLLRTSASATRGYRGMCVHLDFVRRAVTLIRQAFDALFVRRLARSSLRVGPISAKTCRGFYSVKPLRYPNRKKSSGGPDELSIDQGIRLRCVRHAVRRLFGYVVVRAIVSGNGVALAMMWRAKQLQYSLLRSMMNRYKDFWQVTEDGLAYSAHSLKLDLTLEKRTALMDGYLKLSTFRTSRSDSNNSRRGDCGSRSFPMARRGCWYRWWRTPGSLIYSTR